MKDYYAMLGLDYDASIERIIFTINEKIMYGGDIDELTRASAILTNPVLKRGYDEKLKESKKISMEHTSSEMRVVEMERQREVYAPPAPLEIHKVVCEQVNLPVYAPPKPKSK